jgi:hypothetical protein
LGQVDRDVLEAHRRAEAQYLAALEQVKVPPNGA